MPRHPSGGRPPHRRPVQSTVIAAVGYDPDTNVLEIDFAEGANYRYFAVPASVHRDFVTSTSLGTFFAQRIRHTYAYERLPD